MIQQIEVTSICLCTIFFGVPSHPSSLHTRLHVLSQVRETRLPHIVNRPPVNIIVREGSYWGNIMQNRRQVLANAIALGLGLASFSEISATSAKYTVPEGLHHQDWLHVTSFDLRQDLITAARQQKELILLWEQKGCIYCKKMHKLVFSRPDIVKLLTDNFLVVQMDLTGGRKFTGFDGVETTEAKLARKLRVNATPTTLFLDINGKTNFKAPGYIPPIYFKALYRYVIEKAYRDMEFIPWLKTQTFS